VLPGKTFRLNPAVCIPYNADFDGDEMNLHVPQTEEARAEAEILMQVQTQLISPRYGLSIIGCNQDAVSGNFLLTKYLTLTREEAVDLLMKIGISDFARLPNKPTVSGKEVFSCLIPTDFSFRGETRSEEPVVIENGVLKEGYMDKATLGEGQGLLLRNIHKKYGEDRTLEILGQLFRLGTQALLVYGFSFNYEDVVMKPEVEKKVGDLLTKAETEVDTLITDYNAGKLEVLPGRSAEETLELRILDRLNKARNQAGRAVAENTVKTNPSMIMVESGGRGNLINIAQMSACVGQQSFRGGRISKGYRNRTLSCFQENDLSPEARGFIRHGFKQGMKPWEFFFMAMTGRDSLMDTALRTPKSGYLYRRLANALQDVKVEYDHTVREASGKIIQYKYGEEGLDVAKTRGGKLDVKKIIDSMQE
jgi:DNA-directed RNA polymerase subunit A'